MNPEEKAAELGIEFTTQETGYLNLCIQTGTSSSPLVTPAT